MKGALAVALALTFVLTSLAPLMMVSGDAQGPTVEWRLNLRALAYPGEPTAPQVVDLDGDGANELVLASAESVYVIRAKGTQKWRYSVDGIVTGVVAADLDGNGEKEVVAVTDSGTVHCLSRDGAHLWSYDAGSSIRVAPVVGDRDGNGRLEIYVGTVKGAIIMLDDKGALVKKVNLGWAIDRSLVMDPAQVIDPKAPFLFASGSSASKVSAINKDGTVLWTYDVSVAITADMAFGDIDLDGTLDILVANAKAICALNSWTDVPKWCSDLGGSGVSSSLALADLDRDGRLEAIVGTTSGDLLMFRSDGTQGWQASSASGVVGITPVLAPDLNIIVMTAQGRLESLDMNGLQLWHKDLGLQVNRTPIAADMDKDSEMEIMAVGTAGELIMLNSYQVLRSPWPMAGHDVENTRNLQATGDGKVPWMLKWTWDPGVDSGDYTVVADFNGDGRDDILTRTFNLAIIRGDGSLMANSDTVVYGKYEVPPLAVDINGDGLKDIIIATNKLVQAYGNTLAPMWNYGLANITRIAAGDINGDGKAEVFASNDTGHIVALRSSDGHQSWSSEAGNLVTSLTVVDLGSDGGFGLIAVTEATQYDLSIMTVLNATNGGIKWASKAYSSQIASPTIGDFNGDGRIDIVLAAESGDVVCFGGNGTELWARKVPAKPWALIAMDGDAKGQDIAVVSRIIDGTVTPPSEILILDGNNGDILKTTKFDQYTSVAPEAVAAYLGTAAPVVAGICEIPTDNLNTAFLWADRNGTSQGAMDLHGHDYEQSLHFGDLDGDGRIEMVYGGSSLSVYDVGAGPGPTIPWSMFGHDPERTYNPYAKGGRIYPDLTIGPQDITFDPIVANGAIKANVTITYHNQGPIPTGEFNITLTKDGTNLTTFDVLSVPAFSDGKATYKWNVNYENSTLDVALDSGKVVSELRESNNKASRTLSMNLRPVADAGPDIRTDPRKAIILDGSKSKDLDGDVVSYVWDFGDGTTAKGPVVTHGFNKSGPSNVVLTVTDEYGATGSDNRTVWVNHVPTITDWRPKSNTTLNEGENIVFWVMTGDTDGDKVAVTWYLDGVPMAQGNSWSWWANYSSAGTHLVAASASDGSLVANKTWTITVIDSGRLIQDATPPTPVTIPEGQAQQFTVVLSGAAQDAQVDWYLDGHIVQSGTAGFAIYAGPGTQGHHDLELRVQADNAWDYFYWNITIGPKSDIPRIRWAFPDTANITTVFGTPVYMGISSEGGSVQWYVDGKARVGQNDPSFRFDIWGNSSYNVTVIVSSGTNSVFRIWIINIEHPPIANIQPSALNVKINKKVDLDGKNSKAYKATDVITSYQWDFGDGTTGTGQAVKHAYKRAGGYQVTLNVTDSKGMTASTSVTLVVQPAPQASTPGFEGIFLFLAVAITALAVARRRQI